MIDINNHTSQALAARIVTYRILNIGKDEAVLAMQILQSRKDDGDPFDFKSYIDEKINSIPKPEMDKAKLQNIKTVLKNVRSGNF